MFTLFCTFRVNGKFLFCFTVLLLPWWQPRIQFVRFRKRINIQRPAAPHFERAKILAVCQPQFARPPENVTELCLKSLEAQKNSKVVSICYFHGIWSVQLVCINTHSLDATVWCKAKYAYSSCFYQASVEKMFMLLKSWQFSLMQIFFSSYYRLSTLCCIFMLNIKICQILV